MTTAKRVGVCALAVCLAAWVAARAQERVLPRNTGRVLLLRNERALEGDIELSGEQYHIRRPAGELTIPAAQVMCLCAGWDEAFAVLARQANMHDPDERVRLARWCEANGLRAQALTQAAEAVRLRPGHVGAKHLLERLQHTSDRNQAPPPPVPVPGADEAVPAVDLSSESLAMFTTRVQPILMNTCASCHATGRGGNFRLTRCTDATLNRRGLHQNLAAVLAQVNLEDPALSPLLYKAVSPHGGALHAPLPGRQSVPFQTLDSWVATTLAANPHLAKVMPRGGKKAAVPPAQAASPPPGPEPGPRPVQAERPPEAKPAREPFAASQEASGRPPRVESAGNSGPWAPRDFCDPEIFNRMDGGKQR